MKGDRVLCVLCLEYFPGFLTRALTSGMGEENHRVFTSNLEIVGYR